MYIFQNKLDKACFQHDMAYGGFEDLPRRTGSAKVLLDKTFNIAKNPKYHRYQHRLVSMSFKFFDKNSPVNGVKSEVIPNQELAEELHKPIIK